jgi:hypothetical protein
VPRPAGSRYRSGRITAIIWDFPAKNPQILTSSELQIIAMLSEINFVFLFFFYFMNSFEKMLSSPPPDKIESAPEKSEKPAIDRAITEKGSEYKFLPDGRTQRFKKIEGKQYEPQDALVFVPDFEWVKKNAPEKILKLLGENKAQYEQTLLSYVQGKGKKIYIIDKTGKKLEKNKDILAAEGQVFLTFGDKDKVDFSIPVAKEPKIGFYTFDTRKYKEGDEYKRERHLGNRIIEIVEK